MLDQWKTAVHRTITAGHCGINELTSQIYKTRNTQSIDIWQNVFFSWVNIS